MNFDIIRSNDFTLNLDANFAYNHNEIIELYGGKDEIPPSAGSDWIHAVGRPYGSWKMVEFVGFDMPVQFNGINKSNIRALLVSALRQNKNSLRSAHHGPASPQYPR